MLGMQALTQVRALGPFLESSSDDKEESLADFDESRISTAYAGFDGPKDLRRFLDSDDLLGGTDSDSDYYVNPSRECFMCDGDPTTRDFEETPSVRTPINAIVAPVLQGGAPLAPQPGESHLQLEQLQEIERKVEEERLQLAQLRATIEGERGNNNVGAARLRARDVQRRPR
jgi:hypothetical protein